MLLPKANQIQLVVTDMDGTLLNGEHKLTPNTIATVQSLVAQGVEFMLATGRHYEDVYLMAQQLGVEACLITSNGARVHNHLGHALYENHMPVELVEKVLELSKDFNVHRNIYQQNSWLVEEQHEALLAIHSESGFKYEMCDFTGMDLEQIDKIYFTADHEALLELEICLKKYLSDKLYITFTSPEYLEVMNLGVSKGKALEMVMKKRGLFTHEVMALGDGMNDIDMLSLVGHGVIMENASQQVKALLPHLPQAQSNADDGVASYLEQTLLNKAF